MSIEKISIRQVKAARALLAWSQEELAKQSGISIPTIARLESQDTETIGGRAATSETIRATFEAAGVVFISDDQGGPGVRLPRSG